MDTIHNLRVGQTAKMSMLFSARISLKAMKSLMKYKLLTRLTNAGIGVNEVEIGLRR